MNKLTEVTRWLRLAKTWPLFVAALIIFLLLIQAPTWFPERVIDTGCVKEKNNPEACYGFRHDYPKHLFDKKTPD